MLSEQTLKQARQKAENLMHEARAEAEQLQAEAKIKLEQAREVAEATKKLISRLVLRHLQR